MNANTVTNASPKSFSLDHLLLNGYILDRGQLSEDQKDELNRRAALGWLLKVKVANPDDPSALLCTCWRVRMAEQN